MTDQIDNTQAADDFRQDVKILVVGVGGGGGNAVQHMIDSGVQGVDFLVADTDSQALQRSQAGRTLNLGSDGLGAGGDPEEAFRAIVQGCQMVFVAAGMDGGTGSAPVLARIAREAGALTVGVVTKPLDQEGPAAKAGLAELQANVDSLIVVAPNNKLHEMLKSAVVDIAGSITGHSLAAVDFADVQAVMHNSGRAVMATGQATGQDRARQAAEQAMACALSEGADFSSARSVLVLMAASRDSLGLSESRLATKVVQANTKDAALIFGVSCDETLGDAIRITIIATGLPDDR